MKGMTKCPKLALQMSAAGCCFNACISSCFMFVMCFPLFEGNALLQLHSTCKQGRYIPNMEQLENHVLGQNAAAVFCIVDLEGILAPVQV